MRNGNFLKMVVSEIRVNEFVLTKDLVYAGPFWEGRIEQAVLRGLKTG